MSVALLLMVRDEEANLRANVGKWLSVSDVVVCGVDERTSDESANALLEIMDVPRWVFYFRFEDFGQGRSLVLREAWRKFGRSTTHVLTIDPDWDPVTLLKSDIDLMHDTFSFLVFDRNGMTTRNVNWLRRHEKGLKFKYRLHEVLEPSANTSSKLLSSWRIYEREVPGRLTWHATSQSEIFFQNGTKVRGHSQSYERYLKDLKLLDLDLKDLGPEDPHTLYYLGATHLAALEAMLGVGTHARTPATDAHVDNAIFYLERRVRIQSSFDEMLWASMRWLAHAYDYFRNDPKEAETWYAKCHAYDPTRIDCLLFLASLHRRNKHYHQAYQALLPLLETPFHRGQRAFGHNFYVYDCSLPVEAALAILTIATPNDRLLLYFGGHTLFHKIDSACQDPTRRYVSATPNEVQEARKAYHHLFTTQHITWGLCVPRNDITVSEIHLLPMMRTLGLETC